MLTRPMLAAKLDSADQLRFPCLATPKLDGIRCLVVDGQLKTRSFKLVRNRHINSCLAGLPDGLDGELMTDGGFQLVTSAVMRESGTPAFKYWVFDWYDEHRGYAERVNDWLALLENEHIQLVLPTAINNREEFDKYYEDCINLGYEGVCTRQPDSPYVCRRSTPKEQYLVKWKQWDDSEAVILGFKEAMENTNEVVPDNFGYAARPGGRLNHQPKGYLGAFLVRDVHTGCEFSVGGGKGLTLAMRQHIWDDQDSYIGKVIRYRFQPCGTKDKPRIPQFTGFRDPEDM